MVVKAMPIKGMRWQLITQSVDEQIALLHDRLTEHASAEDPGTKRTDGVFRHVTVGVGMGMGQTVSVAVPFAIFGLTLARNQSISTYATSGTTESASSSSTRMFVYSQSTCRVSTILCVQRLFLI